MYSTQFGSNQSISTLHLFDIMSHVLSEKKLFHILQIGVVGLKTRITAQGLGAGVIIS
jgi:hypothetical protein